MPLNKIDYSATKNIPAIFTKEFVSSEQTITAGGALSLAHSLGTTPKLVQSRIICKVADAGYSVSDEVIVSMPDDSSGAVSSGQLVPTPTEVFVRFNTNFILGNKSTGARTVLTLSSWKLIVRAWA